MYHEEYHTHIIEKYSSNLEEREHLLSNIHEYYRNLQ